MRLFRHKTSPSKPQQSADGRSSGESGMTLMEVMVAILILTIALLGLLSMGVVALDANSWSTESTRSTQLVQEKLEQLRTLPNPGSGTSVSADGVSLAWDVKNEGSYLRRVDVTATWKNMKNETETNSLTSYIMTDSL